ncbi:hypothetical protein [Antrihabitans stalactiti]|uniref:HNH endonuclease n=1 Tax=Antrihabitans stalactiti TaxID=2584121 RepID=A0A848KCB5_9NOCA|nr:hypothetical protein [Antrihabitans stalactiti]NMN94824.1 hypothetical protein [Antrihabitans stalactiti]
MRVATGKWPGRSYFDELETWPEARLEKLRAAFHARIRMDTETHPTLGSPCVVWTGETNGKGYGLLRSPGSRRSFVAHRLALVFNGIRDDPSLVVNHLCLNRRCCNVDHAEQITSGENVLLGTGPSAVNAAKWTCVRGHLFDSENTYRTATGGRQCRICRRFLNRRRKARLKGSRTAVWTAT